METELLKVPEIVSARQKIRLMPESEWIDVHGSGTLRKNKRLGMVSRSQYLHERVSWEFGHVFEVLPRSRVTFGDAISESDCKPLTEAGWFIDRYFTLNKAVFPEDYYECKYIYISRGEVEVEGIGIIVRATCAPWIPAGHIVFGLVAEYSKISKFWRPAQNPL
jgi:hypothetical protein